MSLKEILIKMDEYKGDFLLSNSSGSYSPAELLKQLKEKKLDTRSHYQPGMYIAEISESGFLGTVLFRVKQVE